MELTHGQRRAMELAQALIDGTRLGKVTWDMGSRGTSFTYSRTSGSAGISSRDEDGQPPFIFTIYDSNGSQIENIETAWYPVDLDEGEPAPWNSVLAELYDVARSAALNIDPVVDGLLRAVEEGEPPPPPPRSAADDDIPF